MLIPSQLHFCAWSMRGVQTSFVPPNANEYRNVYGLELLVVDYSTDGRERESQQRDIESKWNEML